MGLNWGETWGTSLLICGIIVIMIGVLHLLFVSKDIQSLTPKLPGYKLSQIMFIIACILRGVGWLIEAILKFSYSNNNQNDPLSISPLTVGLPGYLMTISYFFLFYLWCSICVNLISNDSTTGFKKTIKNVFDASLIIIVIFGFALIFTTIYFLVFVNKTSKTTKKIHYIESSFAIFRDFTIGSIILAYIIKIINMMHKPLIPAKSNEAIFCWMLIYLVIALFIRAFSLIIFMLIISYGQEGKPYDYFNTFITAIISEIIPCLMIFINRKRSGLLSVYDLIE